jgi:HD-GYP domain-containing protein (c-di-GMP phosphodiesterase class II)
MSTPEALAEITRCSGTQFDSKIVEVFVASKERQGAKTKSDVQNTVDTRR